MSQAAPKQFLFVSHRRINVGSTLGYSIQFEKGIPTHVPRRMHTVVMEKGCTPCDEAGKALDAPAATEVAIAAEAKEEKMVAPEDQEERTDKIIGVIKKIYAANRARDFSAGGVPSADAVSSELGWRVDQKEIQPIWKKLKPQLLNSLEA